MKRAVRENGRPLLAREGIEPTTNLLILII